MTPLVWTRRAIEDVQSIQRFIEKDSPHYAQLVGQQLIAAVERLPAFPQSGRVVPVINNPAIREVIQGSYRIVYLLIHGEIHILTVHARCASPAVGAVIVSLMGLTAQQPSNAYA